MMNKFNFEPWTGVVRDEKLLSQLICTQQGRKSSGMCTFMCLFLVAAIFIVPSDGENILVLIVTYSDSHLIFDMAVVEALVARGHNVTVVTTLPLKENTDGFKNIHLDSDPMIPFLFHQRVKRFQDPSSVHKILKTSAAFREISVKLSTVLSDPKFIDLLYGDSRFDLVLIHYIFTDYLFGVAAHFHCPVALLWPNQPFVRVSHLIGNPIGSAYIRHRMISEYTSNTYMERIKNFIAHGLERISDWHMQSSLQAIYDEHFPAGKYPPFKEMQQNVSLVLFAHHFSEGPVRPLVPGFVEIGGIQMKEKPDPLPQNIDEFLNDSTESGAIFFSLGSIVRKEHLQNQTISIIYNVLSKMSQKVLWKYDHDQLPGNASNILFQKWFPQDDILAHRNIRLFITHGGKGSITESQYHGVPMVGIPVFGDHPHNMEGVKKKGFGLIVDFRSLTEDSFRNVLEEVLQNPQYARKVKSFSKIFKDRPMTPKQTAVFWLEYVMRHQGAPQLQSPLKRLSFIEAHCIDILLLVAIIAFMLYKSLWLLINRLITLTKNLEKEHNKKVD